jgi:hypothetical protein
MGEKWSFGTLDNQQEILSDSIIQINSFHKPQDVDRRDEDEGYTSFLLWR